MHRLLLLTVLLSGLYTNPILAQSREEKVRNDKQKVEAAGYWIYGDLPKAFAEAKQTGKPIVAVLRCLPCEECVKLDDDLIDADARVKPLLEQFVRVRIVSTNGLDLSLFQFDTDQSFAVFLLNADGTIYGRFGTRSSRKEWIGDVSVDGLAKALQGALALHKSYPANKSELAAKRGPAPEFATPEKFPSLAPRYKSTLDYDGKVAQSCIHCHQIGDAVRQLIFSRKEPLPETILFPYPHPKAIGLILDPKEMATVTSVDLKSPAEQAGFKAGDIIQKLNGQPLLSMADVQWVLQQSSPDGAEVQAKVVRNGKPVDLTLKLEKGWRQRDDIAWRASSWELRRFALGGIFSGDLPDEDRKKWKLPPESTALLVKHVGQYSPHDLAHKAGVRKGDIITAINSRTDLLRETDVLADRIRNRKPGDKLELSILRDGKQQTVTIAFP
ncbi:MAG: serine endoprotease [Planctomycetaceae bacterium]|nr:serine endoprotease [Planctomycetaceae bacterium]